MERAQTGANMALISAIVAVATLGGFLFGFDSGVINGTVDAPRNENSDATAVILIVSSDPVATTILQSKPVFLRALFNLSL